MALSFPDDPEDDQMMAAINTTPLVDVMLVLLIIFLITIPVVIRTVPVRLPQEASRPTQTAPQNVTIAIDRDGRAYWNAIPLTGEADLLARLQQVAAMQPQPEIHIRGDREGRYEPVGKVVTACQQAGIAKIGFITEPRAEGQ